MGIDRVIDKWTRDLLKITIIESNHSNDKDFFKFVDEDLSYEQILNILITGNVVSEYSSSAQTLMIHKKIHQNLSQFMNLPLSSFFTFEVLPFIIKNIPLVTTILGGSEATKNILVNKKLSSRMVGVLFSLVKNIITEKIRQGSIGCAKNCISKLTSEKSLIKWSIPVCASECRVEVLKNVLHQLKHDSLRCGNTDRPKQCKHALVTQYIRVKKYLDKEIIHFNKVKDQFDNKVEDVRKKSSPLYVEKPH
jgi:hypothetical protein